MHEVHSAVLAGSRGDVKSEGDFMYVIKTSRAPRIFITAKNCPECGSEKFYHSRHEAFCSSCSFAIVEE